jgi:hypothetical protein
MNTTPPKIGMKIKVHGEQCTIVRVMKFGTLIAQSDATGQCYQVTGLPFLETNA